MPIPDGMIFCEICQNECFDCPHQRMERELQRRAVKSPAKPLVFAKSAHEMRMDRLRGTSRYCQQHDSDILDCCVPRFKARRRLRAPKARTYTPLSRVKSLGAWLAEMDHWVSCPCGISHEPPVCCQPGEDMDEL